MIGITHPTMGIEEEDAVLRTIRSGNLLQGEHVATFERQFAELCHVHEAVAVSSGSAALLLALLAHNIGPGDEVITTAFNFTASANAILLVGATPVFVDIEADTYTLDPALAEEALTRRTKAIIAVHLYGHPCNIKHIEQFAAANALVLIEDASQAHSASVDARPVGSFGTGCFSFNATKNITTGEGGIITMSDPAIAEQVRLLRNHGQLRHHWQTALGYNSRMTEMQAALGVAQIEKLERLTEQRIVNAAYLTERLHRYIQTPTVRPGCRHVYHQYTIRVPENRDGWAGVLRMQGIETAICYPLPIYRHPFYRQNSSLFRIFNPFEKPRKNNRKSSKYLPMTERAAQEVLSLPIHPALSEEDLSKIVKEVIALCE